MSKEEMYNAVRMLMGYVQNGSARSVTLFQDDATNTYHVKLSKDKSYWGDSMAEALTKAVKDNPEDY